MAVQQSLKAIQDIAKNLSEEFDPQLRELEADRDKWKRKYEEERKKVQNLEDFQAALQIQAAELPDNPASEADPKSSTKPKDRSTSRSVDSSISSASTTEPYARAQRLARSYETLKRKYNNLDVRYKEAKRQNMLLKFEMQKKSDQWREWYDWWSTQKQNFKTKDSTSPPRIPPVQSVDSEQQAELPRRRTSPQPAVGRYTEFDYLNEEDENKADETAFIQTTFDPDTVATRRETQRESPSRQSLHARSNITKFNITKLESPQFPKSIMGDGKGSRNVPVQMRKSLATTASKSREVIELDSPEKSVTKIGNIPKGIAPTSSASVSPAPRPKSAPAQQSRTTKATTPLSTRVQHKKKNKREYPSMKYWTEDGTDGIKRLPPSPDDNDDTGLISAMLEGPPPGPPAVATPLPIPQHKVIQSTPENENTESVGLGKTSRLRDLLETESDGVAGYVSSDGREVKRQKGNKTMSEPRLRRQILSPDLASKNKGRGRYAASVLQRNPGDPPRLEDYIIDPKNNHGVSHAFVEVVRGKEARKSLPATSCLECARFYALHGPSEGANTCFHRPDEQIQQVSKHRHIWDENPQPPGLWKSDFPSTEEAQKYREEAEKRNAEKARQIADEAARGNGRWKKKSIIS